MKAIHKIAYFLWNRISSQVPTNSQAQTIAENCKHSAYKITTCKPLAFAGQTIELETRITSEHKEPSIYFQLHQHTQTGTITHCSPCLPWIQSKWFEAFYHLKTGYEPLKE